MSYILEALKKAQAERQLGSAPTIHALPAHAPAMHTAAASRAPLLAGLGVVLIGAAALAWYALRTPAPVVLTAAPVATIVAPAPTVALVATLPAPAPVPAAAPVSAPAPVAASAPAVPFPEAPPAAVVAPKVVAPKPAVVAPVVAAAAPSPSPASAPAPEAPLKLLRELPDAIQRDVPAVAIGGYIYSANPADRLLLIDKILRKEGEEVAPGLVLEKLMPKGAVMNYRGTRYRVPY